MHRLVMSAPEDRMVDHINHKKFDNRKSNLRICNSRENSMNRQFMSNNKSGKIGVYWKCDRNKWIAQIKHNGKMIYLGCYDDLSDAINRRVEAEKLYFEEYRYVNL